MPVGTDITKAEHSEVGMDGQLADNDANDVSRDNAVVVEEIVLGEVLDAILDVQCQAVPRNSVQNSVVGIFQHHRREDEERDKGE